MQRAEGHPRGKFPEASTKARRRRVVYWEVYNGFPDRLTVPPRSDLKDFSRWRPGLREPPRLAGSPVGEPIRFDGLSTSRDSAEASRFLRVSRHVGRARSICGIVRKSAPIPFPVIGVSFHIQIFWDSIQRVERLFINASIKMCQPVFKYLCKEIYFLHTLFSSTDLFIDFTSILAEWKFDRTLSRFTIFFTKG